VGGASVVVTAAGFTGTLTRSDIVVERWTGIDSAVIDGAPQSYSAATGAITNASLPAIGLTRPGGVITAITAFNDNGGSIATGAGCVSTYTDNFTGAMGVSSEYLIFASAGAGVYTNGVNANTVQETMVGIALMAQPLGPTITVQPTGKGVIVGGTATFSVTATSTQAITYQWKNGGVAIGGATLSSYTTPATVLGDNGASFSVDVTDIYGTIASSAAILSVSNTALRAGLATGCSRECWRHLEWPKDVCSIRACDKYRQPRCNRNA